MNVRFQASDSPPGLTQVDQLKLCIKSVLKTVVRSQLLGEIQGRLQPPDDASPEVQADYAVARDATLCILDGMLADFNVLALFLDGQCSMEGTKDGRLVFTNVPTARGPVRYMTHYSLKE